MADRLDPAAAERRYSTFAIVLHWTIAALIGVNFVVGLQSDALKGLAQFQLLQWHKSFGVTVLVLTLARLAVRLIHRPPPHQPHMPVWERAAATAAHWAFYALMVGIPLTGWIMVSASPLNIPTVLYKVIPWPHIGMVHSLPMATRRSLDDGMGAVHEYLAWAMAALVVLHVGAALRHQFWIRDNVLWRMAPIPGLKRRGLSLEKM